MTAFMYSLHRAILQLVQARLYWSYASLVLRLASLRPVRRSSRKLKQPQSLQPPVKMSVVSHGLLARLSNSRDTIPFSETIGQNKGATRRWVYRMLLESVHDEVGPQEIAFWPNASFQPYPSIYMQAVLFR